MTVRTLVASLCAALAASSVAAQTPSARTIAGVVRDMTGAVMVSVDVTMTGPAGEQQNTTTDAEGRFTFSDVAPDIYRVVARADGFADADERVAVTAAGAPAVELIMSVIVAETVHVSGGVEPQTMTPLASTTLTGAAIEALPDDPGALLQRIREMAGATDNGQVAVSIDGFDQSMWMPPKQAIQAIRISSNWFAPEFAEPGQARIDIITKPGTSSMHGDVRLNFNAEALNARNALAATRPDGRTYDVTGFLSGSIVPERWSFVVYGGEWAQRMNHVINATVLDADFQAVPYVATIAAPSRIINLWVGTNYQLAPLHSLALSFTRTGEDADNLGLDGGLDLAERGYRRTGVNAIARAALTSVPSMKRLNELRVEVSPRHSISRASHALPAVMVLNAFNRGGNQDARLSESRTIGFTLNNVATVFVGKHTLKGGVDIRSTSHRYLDTSQFGGVFFFGADFERDADGTPSSTVISPLENYRRTLLGLTGYGPSQFWIGRGDPDVGFRETSAGIFAQDDWSVSPRLTVSYGARLDAQNAASAVDVGARGGFALALDEERQTMLRAGTGSFFQHIDPALTADVLRLDGNHQEQLVVDRPTFFPTTPLDLSTAVVSRQTHYVADPTLRAPHVVMSAVTVERALGHGMWLTTKYGYQHSNNLLRTVHAGSSVASAAGARAMQLRYESTARLRRHEVSTGWRWSDKGTSAFANYTYVRGRSDADGPKTIAADGPWMALESGPMAGQPNHHATFGTHLPLRGGLLVSPYLALDSGDVFNITTGLDNNGDGLFIDRPMLVAPGTPGSIATRYGTFVAGPAPDGTMLRRNAGREPFAMRMDLRVSRAFRHTAGQAVTVAASVENLFNRANLHGINGVVTSPLFGTAQRAGIPRRIVFSSGFNF